MNRQYQGYTIVDANGDLIGYGINRVKSYVMAYARACNTEDYAGKGADALPFRVVECDDHGDPNGSYYRT